MFTKFNAGNTFKFTPPYIKYIYDCRHFILSTLGVTLRKQIDSHTNATPTKPSITANEINIKISTLSEFRNYFIEHSKPDCFNLILHRHIGDSYVILNLLQNMDAKVHVFIQDKHVSLMELFPSHSYSIFSLDNFREFNFETQFQDDKKFFLDFLLRDIFEKTFPSFPIKSTPFILSPIEYLRIASPYENFVNGWGKMLGLDVKKISPHPVKLPILSLPEKLRHANLENTILLCPDSHSQKAIPDIFWIRLIDSLKNKGLSIVINSLHRKEINGVNVSKLSLREVIAIGQHCKSVISTRSGIADILLASQPKMVIVNPPEVDYKYLAADRNFNLPHYPCEILFSKRISNWDIDKAIEEINNELFP